MGTFTFRGKAYQVGGEGFLLNPNEWDENFAEGMAPALRIPGGPTERHWEIIRFIRKSFTEGTGCPLVYQTCRALGLHLRDLQSLFPTGYQRGACLLAGVSYREGYLGPGWLLEREPAPPAAAEKTYRVDARGFLVDPEEWDEGFAAFKAYELKMPDKLTEKHWQIIYYLREAYAKSKVVPTVYDTCEANHIEWEELERLFPDGYHRGAVKLAGLRVRE